MSFLRRTFKYEKPILRIHHNYHWSVFFFNSKLFFIRVRYFFKEVDVPELLRSTSAEWKKRVHAMQWLARLLDCQQVGDEALEESVCPWPGADGIDRTLFTGEQCLELEIAPPFLFW